MSRNWIFLVALITCACQPFTPSAVQELTPVAPTAAPARTQVSARIDQIAVSLSLPAGWEAGEHHGLVMMEAGRPDGRTIYLFAPPLDEFAIVPTPERNAALDVLRRVVDMPSRIGHNVAISEPEQFSWDGFDSAYYLLTRSDGDVALVLAIEVPRADCLLAINITLPADQADQMRTDLPWLLDGLTINGTRLSGAALAALPDPLPFPNRRGTDSS
jgi:hypothetical protein